MTDDEILKAVQALGYECTIVEDRPYLREDFYSTDMSEANDNYYNIVEDLRSVGLEFSDPYIEHDCITGHIIPEVWFHE